MRKRKPTDKTESIFETERRLKLEAIELAEKFKDIKPVKFDLK